MSSRATYFRSLLSATAVTVVFLSLVAAPFLASAAEIDAKGNLELIIEIGYLISAMCFLGATVLMGLAVRQFGHSTFGQIFSYFFIGTATFFVITIFQNLGPDFFHISEESMDIWWHFMFYLAMISYYKGVKSLLVSAGADPTTPKMPLTLEMDSAPVFKWGFIVAGLLIFIFVIPHTAEPLALAYLNSPAGHSGLHHFLAFLIAGLVGLHLFRTKKFLGPLGAAISTPLLVTIWSLGLQHFWELQFESWKTVQVSTQVGEGGEKIFLTIAGIGIAYAAWRLAFFKSTLKRAGVQGVVTPQS